MKLSFLYWAMISGIDKCNIVKVCLQKFCFFYIYVALNSTKITTVRRDNGMMIIGKIQTTGIIKNCVVLTKQVFFFNL